MRAPFSGCSRPNSCADRHQARHLGLGDGDFLAAPVGEADVLDDVIDRAGRASWRRLAAWGRVPVIGVGGSIAGRGMGCNQDIKMSLYESELPGACHPPAAPGLSRWHCQRAGGAGRQGPALNFYRMPVSWRPARRFWTKVLRSCRRSGLRIRTWPVRAFGPYTGQTRRPSPDPLPASWRPRRSTGRSDQTGVVPNTRGTPELALASRARGSRDPGRRRRSRPTLTTPRESVPRRTGRGRHRTVFHGCQGLFSKAR